MALSPEDIVRHEFKQALRGYAITEVDDLLDRLADQVEHSDQEISELRSRLRDTEARLAEALETESAMKRAFIAAQQAAEAAVTDAQEHADELRSATDREVAEQLEQANAEAERVLTEARDTAHTEIADARQHRAAVEARIEELRAVEDRYRRGLRRHLETQLASIDEPQRSPELMPDLTVRMHDDVDRSNPDGFLEGPSFAEVEEPADADVRSRT